MAGESREQAARREAKEEISVLPRYRVDDVDVQDCGGGWEFTIITADVDCEFEAFAGRETDAVGWFTTDQMTQLSLHPSLRQWLVGRLL
jgi:ADP-ribose pyrophosphatase YjhB (NUDIX family)